MCLNRTKNTIINGVNGSQDPGRGGQSRTDGDLIDKLNLCKSNLKTNWTNLLQISNNNIQR